MNKQYVCEFNNLNFSNESIKKFEECVYKNFRTHGYILNIDANYSKFELYKEPVGRKSLTPVFHGIFAIGKEGQLIVKGDLSVKCLIKLLIFFINFILASIILFKILTLGLGSSLNQKNIFGSEFNSNLFYSVYIVIIFVIELIMMYTYKLRKKQLLNVLNSIYLLINSM